MLDGVLVLDKPAGMSSAAAVDKVKRATGARRAGHAGTLDPLATGVLPICLDEATKLAAYLLAEDKEYVAEAVLGSQTDTFDRTGITVATHATDDVTRERVVAALAAWVGERDQVPPMFSAIKQGGVRLYHRARAGEDVPREPRRVRIERLDLVDFTPGPPPRVRIAIACSKGTYVRSLVADLGRDLGCGAHLAELRRTRAGAFTIDQAQTLGALDLTRMIPLVRAAPLPVVALADADVARVRSGVQLPVEQVDTSSSIPAEGVRFQLVAEGERLVAIAHVEGKKLVYDRVFRLDGEAELPQSPR